MKREYGIDALRIVSMWMVLILHILGQGGILKNLEWPSFRYTIGWFMESAAYGAVNCYGLISGYVGVQSKPKYSSILHLWIQVVFYSTTLSLLSHILWPEMVSGNEWLKGFFPVNFKYYWYYSAYFFISFLIPLLNRVLTCTSKNELVPAISAIVILLSVNYTVFGTDVFLSSKGYSALWLMVLYLLGGCIRLHGDDIKSYRWIKKHGILVFLLTTVAACAPKIALENEKITSIFGIKLGSNILMTYVSPVVIVSAIALFACFSNWKPKKEMQKWIGWIAPATFGVYLIHTHPQIWDCCGKSKFVSFADMKAYVLPFAVLGAATAIFSVCALIEMLRAKLFGVLKVREGCQWIFKKLGLS